MRRHLATHAGASPARESDAFRRLVERDISVDEYVTDLDRRVRDHEKGDGDDGLDEARDPDEP
jgi:hypothetical protein